MSTEKRIEQVKKILDGCVQRGFEFLEKNHPDWRIQVNWKTFDFNDTTKCIAGQLGFYKEMSFTNQSSLGFDVSTSLFKEFEDNTKFSPYAYLHHVWITVRHMETNDNDKHD